MVKKKLVTRPRSGTYRLLNKLSTGGSGKVYTATTSHPGTRLVIKGPIVDGGAALQLTPKQEAEIADELRKCEESAASIARQMTTNLSLLQACRLESGTALGILQDSNRMSEIRLAKAA